MCGLSCCNPFESFLFCCHSLYGPLLLRLLFRDFDSLPPSPVQFFNHFWMLIPLVVILYVERLLADYLGLRSVIHLLVLRLQRDANY